MRVTLIVALAALSGAAGTAAAMPLLDAPGLGSAIPSLFAPAAAPPPAASAPALPGLALPETDALALPTLGAAGERAPRVAAREVERLDRLPQYLLLPDGALVLPTEPLPGMILHRGLLLREGLPAAPAPSAPRASTYAGPDGVAGPGVASLREDARTTGASTPFSPQGDGARVFDPRTNAHGEPTVIWTGSFLAAVGLGLALLLYHRIRPNAALENETRKIIFEAVCAQPGLGVHEVSKIANVSYSTATYHLERLVSAGMIVMTPDGNKLCYYKNGGAFSESERRILPILKNEEAAKLFEAILDTPGTYRAALAERLGVTATTINWHLRRLRDAGLVDETRAGRSAHLYAKTDSLRPTFLTLASKVETTEPEVAHKLRRYADQPTAGASA